MHPDLWSAAAAPGVPRPPSLKSYRPKGSPSQGTSPRAGLRGGKQCRGPGHPGWAGPNNLFAGRGPTRQRGRRGQALPGPALPQITFDAPRHTCRAVPTVASGEGGCSPRPAGAARGAGARCVPRCQGTRQPRSQHPHTLCAAVRGPGRQAGLAELAGPGGTYGRACYS